MKRLALVALALLLMGGSAAAFVFFHARDSGEPMRWFRKNLWYRISTSAEPRDFPASATRAQVDEAFGAWTSTACGLVPQVRYIGASTATHATSPSRLSDEPDNVITFIGSTAQWVGAPADGGLGNSTTEIAITKISHDAKTGEIIDADIEINDGGFEFTLSDDPDPDQIDLLSMLTHEAGHYFGLDHSSDPEATMFPTHTRTGAGATQARTLAADDIDGICALYQDVPDSHYEDTGGDDGDSGNGCGAGPDGGLVWLVGLGVLGRWPFRRVARAVESAHEPDLSAGGARRRARAHDTRAR